MAMKPVDPRPTVLVSPQFKDPTRNRIRESLDEAICRWKGINDYWLFQADCFSRIQDNKRLSVSVEKLVRESGIDVKTVPKIFVRIRQRIGEELADAKRDPGDPEPVKRGNEMTPCRIEWYFDKFLARKRMGEIDQLLAIARRAAPGGPKNAKRSALPRPR